MPALVVIGGQWGDEGKGRTIDLLAQNATIVARYSAGNNAGHTVVNDMGTFRLHLVPAGIFYADKTCLIGNGLVIDPAVLLEEIEDLQSKGVSVKNLYVSDRAHVTMPYHILIDRADEELRGPAAIGTTFRGVGPAFVDKVGRIGVRMGDLINPEAFRERLSLVLPYKNAVLTKLYGLEPLAFDEVYQRYGEYGRRLAPFVTDTAVMVQEALARGETILLEGAQGTLLDLDGGTYEYVTSSVPSSTAAGAGLGIGIGPTQITRVVAVYKAYLTRVGNGPMPTELMDATGEELREKGQEYGATTGRPRRCGWFDAVATRYTSMINGVDELAVTKLDVLEGIDPLKICVAYEIDGRQVETFPARASALAAAQPVYIEMPGWHGETAKDNSTDSLCPEAAAYVEKLCELVGAPARIISIGSERGQTLAG